MKYLDNETEFNQFFPQGLAFGENFCNRISEKEQLKHNILSSRPTLIMSPRRYGKTSLVLNVLKNISIPFSYIDLYSELNETEIQNTILNAIGDVLYSIESVPKKAIKFMTDFFSDLNVNFTLINEKISIEFSRLKKSPAKIILDSLKKLDEILKNKKRKIVLFFDEFQRIGQISESSTIEGAIRHIAQESTHISFVFSGSNRQLLSSMFDNRSKPLYKLCNKMILERISEKDYLNFIEDKFKKKWKSSVSEDVIKFILSLTEKHSYYVNVLCHRLLFLKQPPNEKDVETIWYKYALEEKTNILNEINLLSGNQAKMLIAISKYPDEASPLSKEFIARTKFSLSSASQALKFLKENDYVYITEAEKYVVLDPLIKYIFSFKG